VGGDAGGDVGEAAGDVGRDAAGELGGDVGEAAGDVGGDAAGDVGGDVGEAAGEVAGRVTSGDGRGVVGVGAGAVVAGAGDEGARVAWPKGGRCAVMAAMRRINMSTAPRITVGILLSGTPARGAAG